MVHIKSYESFTALHESKMLDDALKTNNEIAFRIGNRETSTGLGKPTKESLEEIIREIIYNYFFAGEYYSNYCSDAYPLNLKKEYKDKWKKEVSDELVKDIDKFASKYLIKKENDKSWIGPLVYEWNPKIKADDLRNDFFLNSKSISKELKDDYVQYKWQIDDKKIDPKNYEYEGSSYYSKKIKRK